MALTDVIPNSTFGNAVGSGTHWLAQSSLNPVNLVVSGQRFLNEKANKFLVKPKTAKGIGGFVFDSEIETTITLQAEVTDHYTEQNQFFNDHVAHKPMRITLRGLVGEIVATPPQGVLGAISNVQSGLTTLQGTLGKYTPGMVQTMQRALTTATSVVNKIDNAIMRAQNLVGLIVGSTPGSTKQQKQFIELYAMWYTSQVFTVDTPYTYFDNMVIEQVSFMQGEDSKDYSDVSVTLKEVQFAEAQNGISGQSANTSMQTNAGRLVQQAQGQVNKGKTAGVQVDLAVMQGAVG